MLETSKPLIQHVTAKTRLEKLAEVLGCDVSDFAANETSDLGQASELLRLWIKIENSQERSKVLSYVRKIANE